MFVISCSPNSEDENDSADGISTDEFCTLFECPSGNPSIISYPTQKLSLTVGDIVPVLSPTFQPNFSSYVFRTSFDLPRGIEFNKETGQISGEALQVKENRVYDIIIDNRLIDQTNGNVVAGGLGFYQIEIEVLSIAPNNLGLYDQDELEYYRLVLGSPNEVPQPNKISSISLKRDERITTLQVDFLEGGNPSSFSITPELPFGLNFNEQNGEISGTPLENKINQQYTMSAINDGGISTFNFNLEVIGDKPTNLTYLHESPIYKGGEDISENFPIYSGDAATNFAVNPALPQGLLINTQTGIISGLPEEKRSQQSYTITAENDFGQSSYNLSLEVLDNIHDYSIGRGFTCALKNTYIYCWGLNNLNQLGYISNDTCSNNFNCSKVPNLINGGTSNNYQGKYITSSRSATCSITLNSKINCWGDNNFGQLGRNESIPNSIIPEFVQTDQEDLVNISKLNAGNLHFCALNKTSDLYCWGDNSFGQLGISTLITSSNKAELVDTNVDDFYIGYNSLCYLKNENVRCFGDNSFGLFSSNNFNSNVLMNISLNNLLTNPTNLILGESFSVLQKNNLIYSVGDDSFNQLNNSQSGQKLIFDEVNNVSNITDISEGRNHWCFKESGLFYCLGENIGNITSLNNQIMNPEIMKLDNSSNIENVDYFNKSYFDHRCYSFENKMYCFGDNSFGQFGDNTTNNSLYPVEVFLDNN